MSKSTSDTEGLLLSGLDGSSPLAFLAALGTLRTVQRTERHHPITMTWELSGARFTPRLFNHVSRQQDLISLLKSTLPVEAGSPWNLSKKLPFESDRLKEAAARPRDASRTPRASACRGSCAAACRSARSASIKDRDEVDAISSLGCEALTDDKGRFADTALRMVRSGDSAGQGMLDYAQKIRANTEAAHLQQALFEQWQYSASGSSLRWDPIEAREYALLSSDPSKDGALSVIGANRLALEALALFTTCPTGKGLATVGFHQFDSSTAMTWPLWTIPLTLPLIRSLMTLDCLGAERPPAEELKMRGITAVFRSQLFKPNQYYSNFRPAHAVMT